MPTGRIRVYIACSLDGYIAGPDHDLSWLPDPNTLDLGGQSAITYQDFMAEVGALLMGRTTYDVVQGLGIPWPYGATPVLVATHRPLTSAPETARALKGDIDALLDEALRVADGGDVYLDGGALIRQALDAGRVDELIVTQIPALLGAGSPLYPGGAGKLAFDPVATHRYGPTVQWVLRPRPAA